MRKSTQDYLDIGKGEIAYQILIGSVKLSKAYASRIIYTNKNTRTSMIRGIVGLNVLIIIMQYTLPSLMRISWYSISLALILSAIHCTQLYLIPARPDYKIEQEINTQEFISPENKEESAEQEAREITQPKIIADIVKESKNVLSVEEQLRNSKLFDDPIDIFLKSPEDIKAQGMTVGEYYTKLTELEMKKIRQIQGR